MIINGIPRHIDCWTCYERHVVVVDTDSTNNKISIIHASDCTLHGIFWLFSAVSGHQRSSFQCKQHSNHNSPHENIATIDEAESFHILNSPQFIIIITIIKCVTVLYCGCSDVSGTCNQLILKFVKKPINRVVLVQSTKSGTNEMNEHWIESVWISFSIESRHVKNSRSVWYSAEECRSPFKNCTFMERKRTI